jgi:hypothetical protein
MRGWKNKNALMLVHMLLKEAARTRFAFSTKKKKVNRRALHARLQRKHFFFCRTCGSTCDALKEAIGVI